MRLVSAAATNRPIVVGGKGFLYGSGVLGAWDERSARAVSGM
jgi:hypothetical protein